MSFVESIQGFMERATVVRNYPIRKVLKTSEVLHYKGKYNVAAGTMRFFLNRATRGKQPEEALGQIPPVLELKIFARIDLVTYQFSDFRIELNLELNI